MLLLATAAGSLLCVALLVGLSSSGYQGYSRRIGNLVFTYFFKTILQFAKPNRSFSVVYSEEGRAGLLGDG